MLFSRSTPQASPSRSEHSIWWLPSISIDALQFQARAHQLKKFPKGKIRCSSQHCVTPLLFLTAPLLSLPTFQPTAIAQVESHVLQNTAAGGTDKTTKMKQTYPKPLTFHYNDNEGLVSAPPELNIRSQPPIEENSRHGAGNSQTYVSSTSGSPPRASHSQPSQASGYSATVPSVLSRDTSTGSTPDPSSSAQDASRALATSSPSRTHTTSQKPKKSTSPSLAVRSPGWHSRLCTRFLRRLTQPDQTEKSKLVSRQASCEDEGYASQNSRQLRNTPERMARKNAFYYTKTSKKNKPVVSVAGPSGTPPRILKTRKVPISEGDGNNEALLICARQAAVLGIPTRTDHGLPKHKTTKALHDSSIATKTRNRDNTDVFGCLNCHRQRLNQVGSVADLLNVLLSPEKTDDGTVSSLTDVRGGRVGERPMRSKRNDSLSRAFSLPNLASTKKFEPSLDLVVEGRPAAQESKWAPLQTVACYNISCSAVERTALLWIVARVLKERRAWNSDLEALSQNLMYFGEALLNSNEDPGRENANPPHQDKKQGTSQGCIQGETAESNKGPPQGYFMSTLSDIAQAAQARVKKNYRQWKSSTLQSIFRDWGKAIKDDCLKLKLCSKCCLCYPTPEQRHGLPGNSKTSSTSSELPSGPCGCHACNPFFTRDARRYIGSLLLHIHSIPKGETLNVQEQMPALRRHRKHIIDAVPSSAVTRHDTIPHSTKRKPMSKRRSRARHAQEDKCLGCGPRVHTLSTRPQPSKKKMPQPCPSATPVGTQSKHVSKPVVATNNQHPDALLNNSTRREMSQPESNSINLKPSRASDMVMTQPAASHSVPSHPVSQTSSSQARTSYAMTQDQLRQLDLIKGCFLPREKESASSSPVSHSNTSISSVPSSSAQTANNASQPSTSRVIKTGLARFLTTFKSRNTPKRGALSPKQQQSSQSAPSVTASTTRGPIEQNMLQTNLMRFEPTTTGIWKAPQRLGEHRAEAALVHKNSSHVLTHNAPILRNILKGTNPLFSCGKPIRRGETLWQKASSVPTVVLQSKHVPSKNRNKKKLALPSFNTIGAGSQLSLPTIPTGASEFGEPSHTSGMAPERLIVPTISRFAHLSVAPWQSGMQQSITTAGRQHLTANSQEQVAAMEELWRQPSTSTPAEAKYFSERAREQGNMITRANAGLLIPPRAWKQPLSPTESSTESNTRTPPRQHVNNSETQRTTTPDFWPRKFNSRQSSTPSSYLTPSVYSNFGGNSESEISMTPELWNSSLTSLEQSMPSSTTTTPVHPSFNSSSDSEISPTPEAWQGSFTPIYNNMQPFKNGTPVPQRFTSSLESETTSLNDSTRGQNQTQQGTNLVLSGHSHFRPYSPSTATTSTVESVSENSDLNENSLFPLGLREFFV